MDSRESDPGGIEIFPNPSRPAVVSTQSPKQRVPVLSRG